MNVIDYCKWRGDLDFKVNPFNYNDNLLLSELVYCDFDGLFNNDSRLKLCDLADRFFASSDKLDQANNSALLSDSPLFLRAIAYARRFADCVAYNYISKFNEENTEQFAAMMIDLPDHSTVVVFRGTDDTMVGWKEDFNIAYKDLPSQYDATNYLNKNMKFYKKYRVIGHSKGGNLALYASVSCKPYLQKRIIQVISNDGPGLREGSYSVECYNKIQDRYIKIVPEFDIVGLIYDMDEKKIIIKSNGNGIDQHSIINWQIDVDGLEVADDYRLTSKLIKEVIKGFFNKTTIEERACFVDELFDSLNDAGISLVSDLTKDNLSTIIKIIKQLSKISKESKETINILIMEIVRVFKKKTISGVTIYN